MDEFIDDEGELWKRKRMSYEEELLAAASDLMFYMGCNHIVVPFGDDMEVRIVPKGEK